ncbi:MAG TPA: VWA domain-containing protein [Thermoanaerobaculia bacterium]|nr:VWA domain-containing protein [Thermoanaerobaculia bacterium]
MQVVNLDVYITDREGRPVKDLSGKDFQVFEDGRPVELSNFSRIENGSPLPADDPADTVPGAAEPAEKGLHLVVFIDQTRIGVTGRRNATSQLARVLQETLRPEDQVMLVGFDGASRVLLPFTANRKALWAALAAADTISPRQLLARSDRDEVFQQLQYDAQEGPCLFTEELYTPYAEKALSEVMQMIRSLEVFVDSLAGVPGRKAILHLSDGIPLRPGAEAIEYGIELCGGQGIQQGQAHAMDTLEMDERSRAHRFNPQKARMDIHRFDTTSRWEDLSARANAYGVSMYMLQASGAAAETGTSASTQVRYQTVLTEWSERANLQDPLSFLADDTGGRAFLNGNQFEPGLRAMVEDLRSYYLLGYIPPSGNDGLRRIQVKVSRPGLEVRHRTKYRLRTPQEQIAGRLRSRLVHGVGENPLGARIEITGQTPAGKDQVKTRISVKVPLKSLALIPGETLREGLLTVFVAAQDAAGGTTPVRQASVPVRVAVDPAAAGQREFTYEIEMVMRKGPGTLGVAVRDEVGGETSYLSQAFRLNGT